MELSIKFSPKSIHHNTVCHTVSLRQALSLYSTFTCVDSSTSANIPLNYKNWGGGSFWIKSANEVYILTLP